MSQFATAMETFHEGRSLLLPSPPLFSRNKAEMPAAATTLGPKWTPGMRSISQADDNSVRISEGGLFLQAISELRVVNAFLVFVLTDE